MASIGTVELLLVAFIVLAVLTPVAIVLFLTLRKKKRAASTGACQGCGAGLSPSPRACPKCGVHLG